MIFKGFSYSLSLRALCRTSSSTAKLRTRPRKAGKISTVSWSTAMPAVAPRWRTNGKRSPRSMSASGRLRQPPKLKLKPGRRLKPRPKPRLKLEPRPRLKLRLKPGPTWLVPGPTHGPGARKAVSSVVEPHTWNQMVSMLTSWPHESCFVLLALREAAPTQCRRPCSGGCFYFADLADPLSPSGNNVVLIIRWRW